MFLKIKAILGGYLNEREELKCILLIIKVIYGANPIVI